MTLSLAYLDTVTNLIWFVAGVTNSSVMLKRSGVSGYRFVGRDTFALLTNSGKLRPA